MPVIKQFIRVITFIDLPINRKFSLFSLGVLFWFLVLSAVATFALISINQKYSHIVERAIPHERVAQKIARNLRAIMLEIGEIGGAPDASHVVRHAERAQDYLEDIRSFSSALALGGEVNDVSRDTSRVVESFVTSPVNSDEDGIAYLKGLSHQIEEIDRLLAAYAESKQSSFGNKPLPAAEALDILGNLKNTLNAADELSAAYAAGSSELYKRYTGEIARTIRYTVIAMGSVLLVAMILLGIFTHWIADAIAVPIRAIISQIRSLGTGDVDLTNKIAITSHDEIGTLSAEFNGLMETVYGMTTFKNVIEEDANLADIYGRLGEAFGREAGIDELCIYEIKDNQRDMQAVYPPGLVDSELHCRADILTNCELCRARKTGHQISSLTFPGVCKEFYDHDRPLQHICIPMQVGGRVGGVVQFLFRTDTPQGKDPHDIQHRIFKAEAYIKQSLSVLEAKRLMQTLRESALKDPLTGLYNRRFLQDHAQHLIAGARRRQRNIGLLMCDLDYFKQVNDKYGHETGDFLLRETSAILCRSVREADYVIRFGGEEFLVLLIDVAPGEALQVAEKIRSSLAEARIRTPAGTINKTISIGVSEFPADSDAFWQSIKYADVALYKAKETGRNRVVRFDASMWSGEEF